MGITGTWRPASASPTALTPSTVIRAGFGIFYAYQTYNSNPQAKNAPFNGSLIVSNAAGEAGYAAASPISAGFPAARPDLFPAAGTAFNVFPAVVSESVRQRVELQRAETDLEPLHSVGGLRRPEWRAHSDQPEYQFPGARARARSQAAGPIQTLRTEALNCTCANSSLQFVPGDYISNRHFAGLDFQGAYTYAHSIDNSSGNSNGVGIQNPTNLRLYRGNSDFDIRHSLVLSWSYELPFGRGKRFVTGARGVSPRSSLAGGGSTASIPFRPARRLRR